METKMKIPGFSKYEITEKCVVYKTDTEIIMTETKGKVRLFDDKGKRSRQIATEPKNYGAKEWDDKSPEKRYFDELIRISKNQIIWGANHFISKIPYDSSYWVVWDKINGESNFADCEIAWTSFKTAVRMFRYKWNGLLQQDMKNKEIRIHPTQKPVQLYKWLLRSYATPDMKIIDTHVGSGSSIIAFEDFGCEYIGFEIDVDYYEAATKRINQHKAQTRLF